MGNVMLRNGVHVEATAASVRAVQPAGMLTYTSSSNFNAMVGGQTLAFNAGQTVHLPAALAAQLTGLGAVLTVVP